MSPSRGDGGAALPQALTKWQNRRKPATQSFGGYRARNRGRRKASPYDGWLRYASPAAELSLGGVPLCASAAGVAFIAPGAHGARR